MAKVYQPSLRYHFSECVFHVKDSFLSLSLRVTPRMARRRCISDTKSLCVSLDVRVHVKDAYVAIGTIMALYMRIFRALPIDQFFQIASLSWPNAAGVHKVTNIVKQNTTQASW